MKELPIMFKAEMVRAILDGRKTQTRRPVKRGQVFRFCRDGEGPCDLSAKERREINAEPFEWEPKNVAHPSMADLLTCCPYGVVGDRLWVRETWLPDPPIDDTWASTEWHNCKPQDDSTIPDNYKSPKYVIYRASWMGLGLIWRSAMFMPRWASRITLEVVSVRVERVQDIAGSDALAEGIGQTEFWTPKEVENRPFEEKWWDDFEFWSRYPQLAFARGWDSMYGKTPFAWSKDPWVWVVEIEMVQG